VIFLVEGEDCCVGDTCVEEDGAIRDGKIRGREEGKVAYGFRVPRLLSFRRHRGGRVRILGGHR
jgi:hypothetical protein